MQGLCFRETQKYTPKLSTIQIHTNYTRKYTCEVRFSNIFVKSQKELSVIQQGVFATPKIQCDEKNVFTSALQVFAA